MYVTQKRRVAWFAAVALLAVIVAVSGCGGQSAKAVAEVNGEKITRGELDAYVNVLRLFMPNLEPMLGDESLRPMLEGQILDAMIENVVLKQTVAELGLTVTDEDIRRSYDEAKAGMIGEGKNFASEDEMKKKLKEFKINEKDLIRFIGSSAYLEKLEAHFAEGLTDEDIHKFIEDNPIYAKNADLLELSHILFKTEEEALAARERLLAGEDFGDLAVELSEDPSAKNEAGDGYRGYLGDNIAENTPNLWEEFMAGANAIENDGDISMPVETRGGWHLIKLHKRIAGEPLTLAESREAAADAMIGEQLDEHLNSVYAEAEITKNLEQKQPK